MPKATTQSAALETAIGYRFKDRTLMRRALTHSSYAYEQKTEDGAAFPHNEQMEFLGDAVLGMVVGKALFQKFSDLREGQLSRLRSHMINSQFLLQVARQWGVGDALYLGRGEERGGGRQKPAILADAVEALLAAIYLDGGITAVTRVIQKHIIGPELKKIGSDGVGNISSTLDFKSALQERIQATGGAAPAYHVVATSGPDHDRTFKVEVHLIKHPNGRVYLTGTGTGGSKKQAEQAAASDALEQLQAGEE